MTQSRDTTNKARFADAWRRASNRAIRRALTRHRQEYGPEALAAIIQIARERGIDPEHPDEPARTDSELERRPVPDTRTKYFALLVTIAIWLSSWPQVLQPDADLPPCHMMSLIGLSGAWTIHLFARDRRYRAGHRKVGDDD